MILAWPVVGRWISRNRALVVWLTTIGLFSALFLYENHLSAARCEDRRHNIATANHFYLRMAAIERGNPYVNATIRSERVSAYESVVYAEPHC